jgi:hypothetical protein
VGEPGLSVQEYAADREQQEREQQCGDAAPGARTLSYEHAAAAEA